VVVKGYKLGGSHQLWQMNEINKLIWPSERGIGSSTRPPGSRR
jgi:NitT/TauT family transport system substrate-binding protein